ncbi:zf-CCHC domain-containing protein [Tanacetum coccineum]
MNEEAIEESNDLQSLSLDELIGNLNVYEMIIKKDSEIVNAKVERKSLALKAKKESSNEECLTFDSEDKESQDDKNGKSERKCFRCGDLNHLIRECSKPPRDKNQRAFVRGSWSNSSEDDDEKIQDETCLVAQVPNEMLMIADIQTRFNDEEPMAEKTSPRYDLRCKPTGRIFKYVGLRWIPTGKLFDSCTSKVDSEPPHGSNVDIPNIHECKQTLDVSAGTSINVQKEQSLDLSAGTLCNVNKENLRVWLLKKLISQKPLSKWIHR